MAVCVGGCFEVIDGILQLQIDPAGGLECGTSGLKANFPAGYTPTRSPDDCNGLEVRENGLYAPCPDAISFVHQWIGSEIAPLTVSTIGDATFDWESTQATISNTTCCEVGGRLSARAGGPVLTMHDGFRGEARIQVNIDGAGYLDAVPSTSIFCDNSQGVDIRIGLNNFLDENYVAIPAGVSITYQARIRLVVTAGTAAASGIPAVEINWVMPQVGCC